MAVAVIRKKGSFLLFVIVCLMMFNATFNNISVISWLSVLLVKETGGPGENYWLVPSHERHFWSYGKSVKTLLFFNKKIIEKY